MKMLKISTPIVSVDWLMEHFDTPNLIIIDATMQKVTAKKNELECSTQIKNSRFLDIKNIFSDTSAQFPNTMLSANKFQEQAQLLGVNKESAIVVYDEIGIYTSPRVWWMFKSMGHDNIAILDGGFPQWTKRGFLTEEKNDYAGKIGNFTAKYDKNFFCNYTDVLNTIADKNATILDARSEDRYKGLVDEPRKGLRSGHIPNSKNLPFSALLIEGKMGNKNHLQKMFKELIPKDNNIVFSCGSGITACILALGAEISGYKNLCVYDGSWTEWGSLKELPIEKNS